MPKIKLVDLIVGSLIGKKDVVYNLPNGELKSVIGRSHTSNIQIFEMLPEDYTKAIHDNPDIHKTFHDQSQQISRKHCIIYQIANRVMIEDNKSKNKTYVNNKPLKVGVAVDLKNGDILSLGTYDLEVRIEAGEKKAEKADEEPELKLDSG